MYRFKLVELNDRRDNGKNDLEAVLEVQDKKFKGSRLWTYLSFSDAAEWKMREFIDALGLKPKGTLDTTKVIGETLRAKVNADTYEGEYRAKIGKLMKDEADTDDDDDEDDDEPDETDEPDDDESEALYDDMTLDELAKLAKKRDIEIAGRKTKEKYIAALEEADTDEGDGDDDDEPAEPEDDYDEWDVGELQEEIKDRELTMPKGSAKSNTAKLIAVLREDDGSSAF